MDLSRFNPGMELFEANQLSVYRARMEPDVYYLMPTQFLTRDALPGWRETVIRNQATRDMHADILMGMLEISAGGGTVEPVNNGWENFFFVVEGSIKLSFRGQEHTLQKEGYCFLPPQVSFELLGESDTVAKVLWLRKAYQAVEGISAPEPLVSSTEALPTVGDTEEYKQVLLPFDGDMAFDMAVNILTYHPGVTFPCVETHMCVHACYVLDGRGGMWVNGQHNELHKDDFLYIASCASHYAIGYAPTGLRYVFYKEVNRDYELPDCRQ